MDVKHHVLDALLAQSSALLAEEENRCQTPAQAKHPLITAHGALFLTEKKGGKKEAVRGAVTGIKIIDDTVVPNYTPNLMPLQTETIPAGAGWVVYIIRA